MICNKCGAQIPADNSFCGKCGAQCGNNSGSAQNFGNSGKQTDFKGVDYSASFAQDDIEANKIVSLFAYILFFIPLIVAPNSKYARFHVNQGLILFIIGIINSTLQGIFGFWNIGRWIWESGWSFNASPFLVVFNLLGVALLAAMIYGIVNALNGKAAEIPLVGKFRILT